VLLLKAVGLTNNEGFLHRTAEQKERAPGLQSLIFAGNNAASPRPEPIKRGGGQGELSARRRGQARPRGIPRCHTGRSADGRRRRQEGRRGCGGGARGRYPLPPRRRPLEDGAARRRR
jgi:hypothetical protein